MKIKRRWKVVSILPMVFVIIGLAIGPGIYMHGFELYKDSVILFGGYVIGCLTGIVIYHSGIETEERENVDNKFKDDVFIAYDGRRDVGQKSVEKSVNETAIEFDISPSAVRNIIRIYNA